MRTEAVAVSLFAPMRAYLPFPSALVILVSAVIANLGLIPTRDTATSVCGWLLGDVAKLATFWILLQLNLRALLKVGGRFGGGSLKELELSVR